MKNLKQIFWTLCETNLKNNESDDITLVLVCFEDALNDLIFFAKSIDDIIQKTSSLCNSKITNIYISGMPSVAFVKDIYKEFHCLIHITNVDRKYPKYVMIEQKENQNTNLMKNIESLKYLSAIENNFKEFYNKQTQKNITDEILTNDLVKKHILTEDENCNLILTDLGKLVFSKNANNIVKITEKEINNKLSYKYITNFNGPLIEIHDKLVKYIYEILPNYQIRASLQSVIKKPISLDILNELISYIFSMNDYESNAPINIELSPIDICFDYYEKSSSELIPLFKTYFELVNQEVLFSKIINNNLKIEKHTKNKNHIFIKILYNRNIENYDGSLDNIDYAILNIAKNNGLFTRSIIDKELKISPRNSNIHLSKLVKNGYISISGIGKATKYSIKHN